MLKLKGQTESGEWVEFYVGDIKDANYDYTEIRIFNGDTINDIITATIQLADDPQSSDALIKASGKEMSTVRSHELAALHEQVKVLRDVLEWIDNEMDCRDAEFGGCLFTRQDFEIVRNALEQTKPKD